MCSQDGLLLDVPESAQGQFVKQPLLRTATARRSTTVVSLHYDTPRGELRRRGIDLHLRKAGSGWLQVVCWPAGESPQPRMSSETPYRDTFDFSPIADAGVRRTLEKARRAGHLTSWFELNFRRVTWQLQDREGEAVEVDLDRGWIAANGQRAPISEAAVRTAAAAPAQACALALALAERLPLTPLATDRHARGYALARGRTAKPSRALPVPIAAATPPLEAFRRIAFNCLEHLQANHAGAQAGRNPEYVHQMRVATRRLRAAIRMFGPVLGESMVERLLPPLRELMAVLGRTRDYDVILAEIVGPVAAALPDDPRLSAMAGKLTDRRFASHQETTRFLARADYGRFLLAAAGELHAAGGGTTDCGPDTVAEFARKRLRRLQGRIRQLADLVRVEDPATLHALRIAIKRLRYALEFFGPLLPRRSYADTARQLAGLQDTLGQLNDLANAGAVLMGSAGHDPSLREAVALIGGWHGRRHAALLLGVPQGLASLRELRLPKFRKD